MPSKNLCSYPFGKFCCECNNLSTPTWQPVFGQYLARKVFVYVVYYLFTKEFKSYTHKYKFRVVKMVKRGFYLESLLKARHCPRIRRKKRFSSLGKNSICTESLREAIDVFGATRKTS
jgi:hypothetical protein